MYPPPVVRAFAVLRWPLLNNTPKIVSPLAIVIFHGMFTISKGSQRNKPKLKLRFIFSGLCCQLQRRHRQLPRKVCRTHLMLSAFHFSGLEIRFINIHIGFPFFFSTPISFSWLRMQVCSYFRDPLTCIGTVATDQVSACNISIYHIICSGFNKVN